MLSDALPVFVNVTTCAALVLPTIMPPPPPPPLNVAMRDVRASVAEEVAVAVCVPVAEMILSSEKASAAEPAFGEDRVSVYPVPVVHVPDPLSRPK
jgi:hypothetical protein